MTKTGETGQEVRPVPEFLLRGRTQVCSTRKRSPSNTAILAAVTVAVLIASCVTFLYHPTEARSADVRETTQQPFMEEAVAIETETKEEEQLWWLKGSLDLPFTPSSSNAFEQQTQAEPAARTVSIAPAKVPLLKKVKQALAHVQPSSVPTKNPCGTMQHCITVLANNPRALGMLHACRSVLNGGGSASARGTCDALFARIDPPYESGFGDEERNKAAAVCNGMSGCERVIKARPSAVVIVEACRQALNTGSGPAADTCDRLVMAKLPGA